MRHPPPSFPSEELNDSSINTVKSSRAGLMAMLRPIALLQRSVSEKLIQLKQTKRPLAPIKFGWNVKPCDGHTQFCGQSSVIYICIMPGCWAGSPSPWVTVGAAKKCSSMFRGCITSKADRQGVLATTTTHRQIHTNFFFTSIRSAGNLSLIFIQCSNWNLFFSVISV